MKRWMMLGGLLVTSAGCLHEQPATTAGRTPSQQAAAQMQAGQAAVNEQRMTEERAAAQRQAELQRRLYSQQQVINSQDAELQQYRSTQNQQTAPAGRRFAVKLDRPINSSTQVGDIVSARLASPILGPGDVLVAAPGALVTARVVRVQQKPIPRVDLLFRDIETVDGQTVPLDATVQADQTSRAFDALPADDLAHADYDAAFFPRGRAAQAVGGGPPPAGAKPAKGSQALSMPTGTVIQLVLTSPLARQARGQTPNPMNPNPVNPTPPYPNPSAR